MPYEESGASGSSMWYSFNYGNVHFVSFDTETDYANAPEETHGDSGLLPAGGFAPSGAQVAWLEADLAKVGGGGAVGVWTFVLCAVSVVGRDWFLAAVWVC